MHDVSTTAALAAKPKPIFKADYNLEATPDNLIRGALSPFKKPILTVESGAIVDIETVSMLGIIGKFADYADKYGLSKSDPVIAKILALDDLEQYKIPGAVTPGPHTLTGPIAVKGAMPGDVIEVRVLDTRLSTEFGNVMTLPGRGGVPDLVKEPASFRVEFDNTKTIARYQGVEVSTNPFFGIMGLAPKQPVPSFPPGVFGGNMDIKAFCSGASVFLPVQVEGGLYYTGDGHAAQGDGEVGLTAVETSVSGLIQFILHKGMKLSMPMGETSETYVVTGMNEDLNLAMQQAIVEAATFISGKNGIIFNEALGLCSICVNFKIAQVVNGVKGIYASIPKAAIGAGKLGDFWNADGSARYKPV